MKKILISIEDEQKEKLERIKQDKGYKTYTKTIRKIIDEYSLVGNTNEIQGS